MASRDNSSDETPEDSSKVEKGQANGAHEQDGAPPKSVHFFHPSLKKVRKEVYFLWARTSALPLTTLTRRENPLTGESSFDPLCLYPRSSFVM